MRVVIYARESSDDSRNELANLHSQVEQCRHYAAENGWTVVEELLENAQTGNVLVTPKQQVALDMAERGEYDILLARAVDRLKGRSGGQEAAWYAVELKRRGVLVRYADPAQQFQDMPNYSAVIEAAHAEGAAEERKRIVRNMRRGRERVIRNGSVIVGKYPPFGYRRIETKDPERPFLLEVEDSEAEIVRAIFRWYTQGDDHGGGPMSLWAIGRRLESMGIVTRTGRRQWWQNTVAKLVKSETYAGVWTFGKHSKDPEKFIHVDVPAIVERDVWEAAQKQLRANQAKSKRRTTHNYLLQFRLTCGVCGTLMGGYDRGRYYRCGTQTNRKLGNVRCGNRAVYRVATVDLLAWRWLLGMLQQPGSIMTAHEAYSIKRDELLQPARRDLETVEQALAKEEQKLDRLLALYLDGTWDQAKLDAQRVAIVAMVKDLQERRERLVTRLAADMMTRAQAVELQGLVDTWRDQVEVIDRGDSADPKIFAMRRRLVELLDVRGSVWQEDGQKVLQLHSMVSERTVFELPTLESGIHKHGFIIVSSIMDVPRGAVTELAESFFYATAPKTAE